MKTAAWALPAAVALSLSAPAHAASPHPDLRAIWLAAGERAVARLPARSRRTAARDFSQAVRESEAKARAAAPADPEALAHRILADRAFYAASKEREPAASPLEEFLEWLGDRWRMLTERFFRGVHLPANAAEVSTDAALVLATLLVAALAVRPLGGVRRGARRAAPAAGPLEPAALYARANDAAMAGSYRRAIGLLFSAAVGALARDGELRAAPSDTVEELRGKMYRRHSALSRAFELLATAVSAALYRASEPGERDWLSAVDAYRAIVPETA